MNDYFNDSIESVVDSKRKLYTASEFERNALLYIQEIGELKALKPHESSRKDLSSYLFFYVLEGNGVLKYREDEFELKVNDCVFINCEEPYSHKTDDLNLWKLRWIHFNGETMKHIYNNYVQSGGKAVFSLDTNYLRRFDEVWSILFELAKSGDELKGLLINQHLSTLLSQIMRCVWCMSEEKSEEIKITEKVKSYINDNYQKKITLDELSSNFYMNKYNMEKSFKKMYGVTIKEYQKSIIVDNAKLMLRFTNSTIREISEKMGLCNPEYFNRIFKSVENASPSEYRKKWKGK